MYLFENLLYSFGRWKVINRGKLNVGNGAAADYQIATSIRRAANDALWGMTA
jgi:hypothetical protein